MKFFDRFFAIRPAQRLSGVSIALLSLVLLYGCEDPPEACFRVDSTVVDQNSEVQFQNCSQFQQAGYAWDFADGATDNAVSASHRFTMRGTYLVTLTSLGNNDINDDTYSEILKVGNRILRAVDVASFPATKPGGGGDWDATDDPDIAFLFYNGANVEFQTATQMDVAPGTIVTFNLAANNFDLTPDNWTIIMADMDGATAFDTMAVFTQDFALYEPNVQKQVVVTTSNASFSIPYDVN